MCARPPPSATSRSSMLDPNQPDAFVSGFQTLASAGHVPSLEQHLDDRRARGGRAQARLLHCLGEFLLVERLARCFHGCEQRRFRETFEGASYAERFPEAIGTSRGQVPQGTARVETAIPDDPERYPRTLTQDVRYQPDTRELHISEGVIARVDPRIWEYEVSGLRVVRSWLGYRMKERSGRSSSPLDNIRPERWTFEMTRELLELLWVLEGVIALEPEQAQLLDEIVASDLFLATDLPTPTDAERAAPTTNRQQITLGGDFGL